jgi:hypothetical protein
MAAAVCPGVGFFVRPETVSPPQTTSGLAKDWHVAQIGDFNADGRDDILLRTTSGTT